MDPDIDLEVLSYDVPCLRNLLPLTNGFFTKMNYTFSGITAATLDLLLVSNIGARRPSPVVDVVHGEEWERPFTYLTSEELSQLAAALLSIKKPKWDKISAVLELEYDPIHNYLDEWEDESDGTNSEDTTVDFDRTDTHNLTVAESSTRTDNLTEATTHGKTVTRTDNLTETVSHGKSSTRTDNLVELETRNLANASSGSNDIYGFNSSAASHADATSTSGTDTGTVNVANTGTQTNAESGTTGTTDTGTQTNAESGSTSVANTGTQSTSGSKGTTGTVSRADDETKSVDGTDHRERSGKHSGNIGNITSQAMIREEIELWKWSYINEILDDAADFLSLPIYF
jgi:hypothetical protein